MGAGGPLVGTVAGINGIVGAMVPEGTTVPETPVGEEWPVAGPLPAITSPEDAGVSSGVALDGAEAIPEFTDDVKSREVAE